MKSLILVLLSLIVNFCNAQIGIGTTTPNKNAALDITSSNKGLLLPRVNDTGAITDPSVGLLIYNLSTKSPNFHNGTNWNSLSSSVSPTDSITYTISSGPSGYTNGTFNVTALTNGLANGGVGSSFQDISFAKPLDINSTAFASGVAQGAQPGYETFIIEFLFYKRGSSAPYYSLKGTGCVITSIQFGASNSANIFEEQIAVKPIKYGYKNWINNLSFGWDTSTNRPVPY